MSFDITIYDRINEPTISKEKEIVSFLYAALEEYGDPIEQIQLCYDYAMERHKSFGGKIIDCTFEGNTVGAVILNNTGMKGYIPETILVYIAVDNTMRGKGIGKMLMKEVIEITKGSIKLHVEKNNPAIHLYEKVGFKTKYVEMRYTR